MMLGGLTLLSSQAHADLVFVANPTLTGSGIFAYDLNFSTNVDIGTGQPSQRLVNGSYATIYDMAGFNSATLNGASANLFTLTTAPFGQTPAGIAPTDTALTNITLTYNGPTLTTDQSFADILTVNSSFTSVNTKGQFSSTVTKNTGVDAGTALATIGSVAVPGVTAATPEPGSMALLVGAALSGSVFAFRRRRRK